MEEIQKIILSGAPFDIKVIPKSSVNKICLENNLIKIKIIEIPEDGKANKAVISLISKSFKIPQKNIEIIKGQKGHNKTIKINF